MSFLICGIVDLVHLRRCIFEQGNDLLIHLCHRHSRIVILSAHRHVGLFERHRSIGSHEEEIGESFLELHLSDGIVLVSLAYVAHCLNVTYGFVGVVDEVVRSFPHLVERALALKVAGTEVAEEPVGTRDVVGIEFEHTWELSPAHHVVEPVAIYAGDPLVNCLFGVAKVFRSNKTFGFHREPVVARGVDHRAAAHEQSRNKYLVYLHIIFLLFKLH